MNKYEMLDAIYEIDYKVTLRCKKIASLIQSKTHLGVSFHLLTANVLLMKLLIPTDFVMQFFTLVGVFFITIRALNFLIYRLHKMIDPENFSADESHARWTFVFQGIALILGATLYSMHPVATYFGIGHLLLAYYLFCMKKVKPPKKRNKKKESSDALEKLLERCRGWLGQKQPLPTT